MPQSVNLMDAKTNPHLEAFRRLVKHIREKTQISRKEGMIAAKNVHKAVLNSSPHLNQALSKDKTDAAIQYFDEQLEKRSFESIIKEAT